MAVNSVTPPFETFKDVDGDPLDKGFVYIGEPGQSAEFFPKDVFWDSDLSVAATQPIETQGGFAMNSGSPGALYVDGDYSITVKDRKGNLVQSALNSASIETHPTYTFSSRSAFLDWQQDNSAPDGTIGSDGTVLYVASAGATAIADMPGWLPFGEVTPEHFGAAGDGTTDDTAAFSAALSTKQTVVCDGSKTYAVDDLTIAGNEALDLNGATLVPASSACRWLVRLNGFDGPQIRNGYILDSDYVTVKTATTGSAASAGDTTLSLASTTGLEAGMALAVGGTTAGEFSIRKIASVAAGSVTFDEGLQSDVSSGAVVHCSFGLLSIYSEGSTTYNFKAQDLRIRGGGVHLYQHGTSGSDIARGLFENIYSQGPLIAQEVIFNNCHDIDRVEIQSWGSRTLSGSSTATASQTTVDVEALVGAIPVGAVFTKEQVSLKVNGTTYTYTAGAPGVNEYTASSDGLTLTVQALSGGESITLSVFDRPFTSVLYDPHGTGTVQGAHKWLRALYLDNHSCAMFENESNSAGLLHFTQVNFDAGAIFGVRSKDCNKLYMSHVFSGATPFPFIFDLVGSKPDRIVMGNGVWTAVDTAGHFDTARVSTARAVTVNASGPEAAVSNDGKPKIRFSGWVGPDYSTLDTEGALTIGSVSNEEFDAYNNIRVTAPSDSGLTVRSYGGTLDTPTAVTNNTVLAQWLAQAHNGTDFIPVGNLRFVALQNHSGTQSGTRLEARVTGPGDTSTTQILNARVDNSGYIRIEFGAQGSACLIIGSGSPEGSATAPVGSTFMRTDGGAGTSQYVKESGTGNTGWVAK